MFDKQLFSFIKEKQDLVFKSLFLLLANLFCNLSITALCIYALYCFIHSLTLYALLCLLAIGLFAYLKFKSLALQGEMSATLADYVVEKLRIKSYTHFLDLRGKIPLSIQETAQLSTEGIEQLRLYYSVYLSSFFYAIIAPLLLFILFSFLDFQVALTYLFCIPLIPLSIIAISKWAKKIFHIYWDQYLSLGDCFLDSARGMKELKIFNYDEIKQKEMSSQAQRFREITMKVLVMQLSSVTIMDLVAYLGAGIGIVLSLQAMREGLDMYVVLFMILVGAEFFLPLRQLGSAFHIAMNGVTAGKKILTLLSLPTPQTPTTPLPSPITSITCKNLSFSYGDREILKNLNLTLSCGLYSIVGLSGSGKSTLSKLLTNSLIPTNGEILYNSTPLSQINPQSFYKKVAYLSNQSFLFSKSLKELFAFYNPNITEERIWELLSLVQLKDFVLQNKGLDFCINPSCSNLSGGEKQRLLLALYLSNDYEVFVFDEITSNIDKESEEIIINLIKNLSKDKIILLISHRLKNTLSSDYIFVIKDGAITERGKAERLLEDRGEFFALYNQQIQLEEI